jgi:Ca2+/Na+ antiporter
MFIVGLGTTIPELFFSLQSVRKKDDSLAIGDLAITAFYTGPSWMVGVNQLVYPFTQAQLTALPSLSGAVVTVGIPGRSWLSQGFDVRK